MDPQPVAGGRRRLGARFERRVTPGDAEAERSQLRRHEEVKDGANHTRLGIMVGNGRLRRAMARSAYGAA